MFSFFRSTQKVEEVAERAGGEKEEAEEDIEEERVLEVEPAFGCCKGWPINSTVVLYHDVLCLICVGTVDGCVYVYGDGFQFVSLWLTDDPNEVISINALFPDKILVSYANNGLVVLSLPALEVINLLKPSWLSPKAGDITTVHTDLASEKNFAYVGSSEGIVQVIDCNMDKLRICDYRITAVDAGVDQGSSVTDICSCPKDERYLAIGYDVTGNGVVVIYDLVKGKPSKTFKLRSVTCLTWSHAGDMLYAGTTAGEVVALNADKGTSVNVWNAAEELLEEVEATHQVLIRQLSWLAPQRPNDTSCLFAMLSTAAADNDNLKHVVVGLAIANHDCEIIFALPPQLNEKLIAFRLVPTVEKGTLVNNQSDTEHSDRLSTPGLLLLMQQQDIVELGKFKRRLKIMRCPPAPAAEWKFEIGMLPEPRLASEVLPARSTITCVTGALPHYRTPLSLTRALVSNAINDENRSIKTSLQQIAPALEVSMPPTVEQQPERRGSCRRISARDFYDYTAELEQLCQDSWELVLVCGVHEEQKGGSAAALRMQDLVVTGQEDGSLIVYGLSLPEGGREVGSGNVWLPLTALKCQRRPISAIAMDESCGLLACGDKGGNIVMFELFDEQASLGAVDVLQRVHEQVKVEIDRLAAEPDSHSVDQFRKESVLQRFQAYLDQRFTCMKEACRGCLGSRVSSVLVLGQRLALIAGTEDGEIFVCSDLRSNAFVKVERLEETEAKGPVLRIEYSYYLSNGFVFCAVFAYFASGHLVVLDFQSMSVMGFSYSSKVLEDFNRGENEDEYTVSSLLFINEQNIPVPKPLLQTALYLHSVPGRVSNLKQSGASDAENSPKPSADGSNDSNEKPARKGFFTKSTPPRSSAAASVDAGSQPAATSSSTAKPAKQLTFDAQVLPRRVLLLHGTKFISFDLTKMFEVKKRESIAAVATRLSAVVTKDIFDKPIISSCVLCFRPERPEQASPDTQRQYYLGCVDTDGVFSLCSLTSRSVLKQCQLLQGITEQDIAIDSGCLLANGNMYLNQKESMVYSCGLVCEDWQLTRPLPGRASPSVRSVDDEYMLSTGREVVMAAKQKAEKRRSSMLSLSKPTDLNKLFSKARDQQQKDDLFGRSKEPSEEEETAKRSARVSQRTITELQEARERLEERGEKINRIAIKMDDFKQSAAEMRNLAKQQKEILKKRNSRWGLF